MLTTTIVPTSGSARLAGHDVVRSPLLARSVSSVVFQEAVVDRGLSGRANLELHTRLWGVPAAKAKRRTDERVQALGLSELIERPVSSYSGGERRRLEIARALTSAPQVLFMDEPTVGLDPRIRHELLDVIAGLRDREELTILITTHYLDEAQRLCDRVAIIHEGSIVALDSPQALLAGLGREILEFRTEGSPERALAVLREQRIARDDAFSIGARVTVPLHDRPATEALAAIESEQLRVSEIATRVPNLDVEAKLRGGNAALKAMEGHLADRQFLVAGRYTIADIALYAYTHVAPEGGFELEPYPAVRTWLERVSQQPGHVPITA